MFPIHQRGLANGLTGLGMALGFSLGTMISATYLSPLLDGWRNVFILYGVIGLLFAIPWSLTHYAPPERSSADKELTSGLRQGISHLVRLRKMWLLGFVVLCVNGGIQGLLGYLPLYLQNLGWKVSASSGVMAAFHLASMIFVLPLTFWSDRIGSRSKL